MKHNLTGTPEFNAWRQMVYRCHDKNHPLYPRYGAKGICVTPEWLSDPRPFILHTGPRPSAKHTIDRIDNKKGYEPGNVRWATWSEQALNRRTNPDLIPGVKIYKATGLWSAITPCHPKTKKFRWLGRKFMTAEEAVKIRQDWLATNWPDYPRGFPQAVW